MAIQDYINIAVDALRDFAPKFVGAVIALVVGWIVIKLVIRGMRKGFEKKGIEKSLASFLLNISDVGLKILLFITVASMMGVAMTSFVAILGAAGLAIGLALQGSLSNFAGGVLILLAKPFKVGEVVDAQGHKGTIREISILYTTLETFTGEYVTIPNGDLANSDVVNFSRKPTRRLDLTIGISYDSDIKKAQKLLKKIISKDDRVLEEPQSTVDVGELGGSSVDFRVTMWTENKNFLQLKLDLTQEIKLQFDKADITFPFPSRDVYIHK